MNCHDIKLRNNNAEQNTKEIVDNMDNISIIDNVDCTLGTKELTKFDIFTLQ